jgi:flagellar biosynthesis/type III secretory pathway chaperone
MDLLEQLVAALREELQQYGQMLLLLDQQQEYVLQRATGDVLNSVADVEMQGMVIQKAREDRVRLQSSVALSFGLAGAATFSELLEVLPLNFRLLVHALVEENNSLLVRVQQRVRQNHLLLARSLELMQRFVRSLFPSQEPARYNDSGTLLGCFMPANALYEAVG